MKIPNAAPHRCDDAPATKGANLSELARSCLRRWRHSILGPLVIVAGILIAIPSSAGIPVPRGKDGIPTLAPILRKVTPGVVNISVITRSQQTLNPLLRDPFFRHFFNVPRGRPERAQSAGSGVIIDAKRGLVITNHHVIEQAAKVTVTLKDGRRFDASPVGSDPGTDIALLRIEASNLTAVEMGNSDQLEVGDFVVAIGNPFGLGQTVTSGIVSALGRSGLNLEGYEDFIQTDASINPGNSGGALIDLRGRLVGVNTAIIGPAGGNVGIGFAVPTSMVRTVVKQLVTHGRMRRGRLGIQIQELTPDLARAMSLGDTKGVVITRVQDGSSAQRAGLRPGDVIVAVGNRPIDDLGDLRNRIGLTPIGETVRLTVIRKGERRRISVKVGAIHRTSLSQPAAAGDTTEMTVPKLAGAVFRDIEASDSGLEEGDGIVVDTVDRNSPAWGQGLRPGDLIVGLNQVNVTSLDELARVLRRSGNALAFSILRDGDPMYVIVQ